MKKKLFFILNVVFIMIIVVVGFKFMKEVLNVKEDFLSDFDNSELVSMNYVVEYSKNGISKKEELLDRKVSKEELNKLLNFIGKYNIKEYGKGKAWYNSKVMEDETEIFYFTLENKDETLNINIFENYIDINDKLYEVVDNSVDMSWLNSYAKKNLVQKDIGQK